jgi:hypothetical protein
MPLGAIANRIFKKADNEANIADMHVRVNNLLKQDSLRSLGNVLIAGLGVGALGRGAVGLAQLASKNYGQASADEHSAVMPTEIAVPHLVQDDDEEEEVLPQSPKRRNIIKIGIELFPGTLESQNNSWSFLTPTRPPEPTPGTPAWDDWDKWRAPQRGIVGIGAGDKANSKVGIPWYIPAAALIAGGGLYGGYKAVDSLFNKRQKDQREEEIEEAKTRYRNALFSQYTPEQLEKRSEDLTTSEALDVIYDEMEKKSSGDMEKLAWGVYDVLGGGLGTYGLLAAGLAGGTGLATYNYFKARSPEERLKKVIQQRARERWLRKPPEVYAVPVKLPVTTPQFPDDENEDKESLEEKAAKIAEWIVDN